MDSHGLIRRQAKTMRLHSHHTSKFVLHVWCDNQGKDQSNSQILYNVEQIQRCNVNKGFMTVTEDFASLNQYRYSYLYTVQQLNNRKGVNVKVENYIMIQLKRQG